MLTGKIDHYSAIATVCANWDLRTLGRWDVGANVFSLVAAQTGDSVSGHPNLRDTFLNESYPGPYSKNRRAPLSLPNLSLRTSAGRLVSEAVRARWQSADGKTYYYAGPGTQSPAVPDARHPPVYVRPSTNGTQSSPSPASALASKEGGKGGCSWVLLLLLPSLLLLFG